jgi:hypothetical protein
MPGWKPLIVCDGVPGGSLPECNFSYLIELVRVLIHDMVLLSTLLAVGVFAYAGFILLTSGGDTGAMKQAKGMFLKVLIGYMWILAAWLIVYTITSVLLNPGYSLLGAPRPN